MIVDRYEIYVLLVFIDKEELLGNPIQYTLIHVLNFFSQLHKINTFEP